MVSGFRCETVFFSDPEGKIITKQSCSVFLFCQHKPQWYNIFPVAFVAALAMEHIGVGVVAVAYSLFLADAALEFGFVVRLSFHNMMCYKLNSFFTRCTVLIPLLVSLETILIE